MKIQVLVHAAQWLDRAGVRIRYRRIAPHLEQLGSSLSVDVMSDIGQQGETDADVVIFSKCTDARAVILAQMLRQQGVLVGIDLFDDYFSPTIGPCHTHRQFLRDMAGHVDFFLCSTGRMRDVGQQFSPGMPTHVMNDPLEAFDEDQIAARLTDKAMRAREARAFEVLWFGNGDNPTFPVGLTDLAAFGSALRPFALGGYDVRLRVLTNLRALGIGNLARLRNLPVPMIIDEWSEEGEKQAAADALVSFLPVNYQNFSIAKSLNRGISALTGTTQILSAGYDLYGSLGDFIYRDAAEILQDLADDRLRLRADTVAGLARCMDQLADPANEAEALHTFLRNTLRPGTVAAGSAPRGSRWAIVHGGRSPSAVHTFTRTHDIISIASPMTRSNQRFDVAFGFDGVSGDPCIFFTAAVSALITDEHRPFLQKISDVPGAHFRYGMDVRALPEAGVLQRLREQMIDSRSGRMVHYVAVMDAVESVAAILFPDVEIRRSEQESPLMGLDRLTPQKSRFGRTSEIAAQA